LKKRVELTLFTDPAIPAVVLGDTGRLRQILINLVNNAIKFSSGEARQGKVSVRALASELSTERVIMEFQVADNGIGIDQETQAKLFMPFTQANIGTTRRYGGTGLGLAITLQLVNRMGGEIVLQSEPGRGPLFSVRIPFPLPSGQSSAENSPSRVAGLSCLVVDGPDGIAGYLAAYLAYDQAKVTQVRDMAGALQWITGCSSGMHVVVIDTTDAKSSLEELRAAVQDRANLDARFVIIGRGGRRKCRIEAPGWVSMDAEVMIRQAFLEAVAIAAGRLDKPVWDVVQEGNKFTATPLSREKARLRGSLILVAEDNDVNQKVILHQLKLLGQTADIANNGREALMLWKSGNYGMLFTDLHMPEMDGYELTAAIREVEGHDGNPRAAKKKEGKPDKAHMPIIAITANATRGEAERCIAIGMDDYLSKPVQLVNLKAMLEKWMPLAGTITGKDLAAKMAMSGMASTESSIAVASLAVDVKVLKLLVGDDEAVIGDLLHDFRISAAQIAARLRAACAAGDTANAEALSHKLKSSARAVGALALGEICADMEQSGKAGDGDSLNELLPRFERELEKVEDYFLAR